MRKRTLWLILSCLMVAALVLASCAPAAKPTAPTTPTTPTAPTTPATSTTPITSAAPTTPTKPIATKKPTYGGTITIAESSWAQFDTCHYDNLAVRTSSFASERLAITDWAVDRNLYSFATGSGPMPEKYMRGQLLESWETPDPLIIILHVRQGVHFHDKPPVNGREFTADDIVWNIERYKKSPFVNQAQLGYIESINKKDKWTVELRLKPPPTLGILRAIFDEGAMQFWAKEGVGKSGYIEDWHNIIGTGPFMIEDYVPDSCVTFKRNPNYWGFDERHPEYKLPYADFAKVLLIVDPSTKYAGMRTGKIDWLYTVPYVDADSLVRTAPHLVYRGVPASIPRNFAGRYDTPPFNDVRVRQAMNMCIDRNEIIKSFFGGHASYYISVLNESTGLYTPYEKLPDKPMWTTLSCKEVVSYNPKRAKELLAEAGYPKGFKTRIDTSLPRDPGLSELFQFYLAQIGIEAQINVMEWGAFTAAIMGKQMTAITLFWTSASNCDPFYYLGWFTTGHQYNPSNISDRYFDDLYYKARTEFDDAKREKMIMEMQYRAVEMAYVVLFPHFEEMFIWQPWLKGYAGEGPLSMLNMGSIFHRVWVDQELKKSLGF